MNRRELANEFTRRYKKEPNKKQPLTRNEAGYKYRLYFIQDDLKNGIDPFLKIEFSPPPNIGIISRDVSE